MQNYAAKRPHTLSNFLFKIILQKTARDIDEKLVCASSIIHALDTIINYKNQRRDSLNILVHLDIIKKIETRCIVVKHDAQV